MRIRPATCSLLVPALASVACSRAAQPHVVLVAAAGQLSSYPARTATDEGMTMIAPLACAAGEGEACLASIRTGQALRSADGRVFHLGRRTRAWNCDTHDGAPEYYAAFASDVEVREGVDQLLVTSGPLPMLVAPGTSEMESDLDGDGVPDHVAVAGRNVLSIRNGRTGDRVHIAVMSGLSIMHLVGAADLRGNGQRAVIVREGHWYRAVGIDGHSIDLGFGCAGV